MCRRDSNTGFQLRPKINALRLGRAVRARDRLGHHHHAPAVEAGACPHTVIREDPTLNIAAGDELERKFPGVELIMFESGGDNLASTFSLDLVAPNSNTRSGVCSL